MGLLAAVVAVIAIVVTVVLWAADDNDPSGGGTTSGKPSQSATKNPGSAGGGSGDGSGGVDTLPPDPSPTLTPALKAQPDSGPVGAKIKLIGNGFDPGEAVRIEAEWEGDMRDTTANSDGSIAVEVIAPNDWDGYEGETFWLSATGLSSDTELDTLFYVTK